MPSSDTETTLCMDCQTPIEAPKLVALSPFMAYKPTPLCKDCLLKYQTESFEALKYLLRPYKLPHWRPKRA